MQSTKQIKQFNPTQELFSAIECADSCLVKIALEQGADLSVKNVDKLTPIELAYELRHFHILKLIANTKTEIHGEFLYGHVLINIISDKRMNKNEQYDCAYSLLKGGADPGCCYTETKNSTLHKAALSNKPYLVALLLSFGANPEAKNKDEITAKELNPKCFNQGWAIMKYNSFIPGILIALCQAFKQDHPLATLFLNIDLSSMILTEAANGFLIDDKRNTLFSTRVSCLVSNYQLGFFHWKSSESKALVNNLDKDKYFPEKIKEHIDRHISATPTEQLKNSRAINLLKEFRFINNSDIEKIENDRNTVGDEFCGFKIL